MSPEKQREKELFEAALDLADAGERNAFLDRSCGEDAALRLRLQKLLDSQAPAEAFLTLRLPRKPETASPDDPSRESDDGMLARANVRIGRYKLLQRLGEGGCGVVYLAEQQEPVRREVALKIIRMGVVSPNIGARFQMEQQAMAWMEHPNIARVLDAGETAAGRPYFVMEWVRGAKITDYCDEHRLPLDRRIDLFAQVCNAIQHAHQKGVIHRDIKPSNILVALHDGLPVPKVIDFGISRLIEDVAPESTDASARVRFVGTPAYMSPEQAEPEDRAVDTRSDIYSLGALLYELLAGRPPFDSTGLDRSDAEAVRHAIRERSAPPPPSALVASLSSEEAAGLAVRRDVAPRALVAALRNDLDQIVMKAMEKDPGRRYETAHGLARDIRRHQDHEPVVARPPTRLYHLRKLVRRNRQIFVAGALVLATLIAALAISLRLYYRERDALREQTRLRAQAEEARANELSLRRQAEAREKFAQAAVSLNHGDIAAADALVADIPLELTPPSLEAAGVLRGLGQRHVFAGRWAAAAERFGGMVRALTRVDSADTDNVSRELLPAGAVIGEAGTPEAYERFRHMAVDRFAQSAKPIPAEHTIKTCLLKPADAALLRQLEPLAHIAAATLENPGARPDQHMLAWRSFALGLFEYRRGRYVDALSWVQRCEAYQDSNRPRFASSRLVFALCSYRLHRDDEARDALKQARGLIEARFLAPLDVAQGRNEYWFDWINARILLREATPVIDDVSAVLPPAK